MLVAKVGASKKRYATEKHRARQGQINTEKCYATVFLKLKSYLKNRTANNIIKTKIAQPSR
ncbi:hypothetical protein B5J92_05415 [Moraxella atlantae]|nr:hypothetical protein B5J92_05415 [Moraxella atlantae]